MSVEFGATLKPNSDLRSNFGGVPTEFGPSLTVDSEGVGTPTRRRGPIRAELRSTVAVPGRALVICARCR